MTKRGGGGPRDGVAHRPATMKDIATAAGVAQSTVSRILNDAPVLIAVSDETRKRVQAIAIDLGYRPHPFARALRGAPSMLLGAVVRDITDPFFAEAIEALSIAAKERGYSVVLGHARAKADEALALTAVLETRHCDAIVLVGDFRGERRLVSDLRNPHLRVVGLWHGSERSDRPFPTVIVDARAGIHAALAHLVSLGHQRIAFVGHPSRYVIRDRLAAYEEYLATAGLPLIDEYIRHVPNTIGGGHIALSGLLALAEPPTAVMAATDFLAMDMLHAASASGLSVPEQISIVGFDDMPFASATVPSLTTVKMPITEMVAAGLELAVGESEWPANGEAHPPRVVFEPKLIVRRSSGQAPKRST
ncbi:MAG TPA: LacI family DNA-binding transcriptional regulator [Solirubrobacteraceae bacterium]|jgi:DNA-binding LacI/PurR family transcriptional regulator|nr:LacI family DNA-binding transcriptional regulator [Solirubrobacteraceae bacterium]